jgi:uncharacterized membrane protein
MNVSSLQRKAFLAAIAIKGLDGAVETVAGLIIAIAGAHSVYSMVLWVTAPELSNHPHSHALHAIRHGASHFAHGPHRFIVIYLLAHGIVKLALAINLIIGHRWIFPVASIVFLGFIGYMGWRLFGHWSTWLAAFALFDVMTLALVLNEWRRVAAEDGHASVAATA